VGIVITLCVIRYNVDLLIRKKSPVSKDPVHAPLLTRQCQKAQNAA
jgi:hypothetical protein